MVVLALVGCRSNTPTHSAADGLQSFRYDLTAVTTGVFGDAAAGAGDASLKVAVTGDVADTHRERTLTEMKLGASTVNLERVRVDDKAWSREGKSGNWSQGPASATSGTAGLGLDSTALLGADARARIKTALEGLTATDEQVGDVAAQRYTVPAERMRVILGASATGEQTSLGRINKDSTFWVTKDGQLPVKFVTDTSPTTGGTVHIEITMRDRNATIEVKQPGQG
ncbi:MAG: hypothetical protein DWI48_03945 [Chloroflexi bacterium]|nr:MAG: hypothetical protein DWI48_03945 [Chloroflexota bacterium]